MQTCKNIWLIKEVSLFLEKECLSRKKIGKKIPVRQRQKFKLQKMYWFKFLILQRHKIHQLSLILYKSTGILCNGDLWNTTIAWNYHKLQGKFSLFNKILKSITWHIMDILIILHTHEQIKSNQLQFSVNLSFQVSLCFQKVAAEILGIKLTRPEIEQHQRVIKAEISTYNNIEEKTKPVKSQAKSGFCVLQWNEYTCFQGLDYLRKSPIVHCRLSQGPSSLTDSSLFWGLKFNTCW